jgi:glyoxylase-like metal-dependent hydrolase (beta-lactamase superfamily II)
VCFLDRESRQLFSGDTVCEWGILLHFAGESCPPEVLLSSMQRLKSVADAYDAIWPGHHGFPLDKDYVDDYLACARQIVDGTARYKKDRGRRCACYGRIIITLPAEDRKVAGRG